MGIACFKLRKQHKTKIYSHENELAKLTHEFENKFKLNKKAWNFFVTQAPSYQKVIIHWITTAKQQATQQRRLDKAITESAKHKRLL